MKKYDEFKSELDKIVADAKAKLTKDSSKEEIESVSNFESQINTISASVKEVYDENADLKDKLIKSMRLEGSSEKPEEEKAEKKDLMDYAKEELDKSKK